MISEFKRALQVELRASLKQLLAIIHPDKLVANYTIRAVKENTDAFKAINALHSSLLSTEPSHGDQTYQPSTIIPLHIHISPQKSLSATIKTGSGPGDWEECYLSLFSLLTKIPIPYDQPLYQQLLTHTLHSAISNHDEQNKRESFAELLRTSHPSPAQNNRHKINLVIRQLVNLHCSPRLTLPELAVAKRSIVNSIDILHQHRHQTMLIVDRGSISSADRTDNDGFVALRPDFTRSQLRQQLAAIKKEINFP